MTARVRRPAGGRTPEGAAIRGQAVIVLTLIDGPRGPTIEARSFASPEGDPELEVFADLLLACLRAVRRDVEKAKGVAGGEAGGDAGIFRAQGVPATPEAPGDPGLAK